LASQLLLFVPEFDALNVLLLQGAQGFKGKVCHPSVPIAGFPKATFN